MLLFAAPDAAATVKYVLATSAATVMEGGSVTLTSTCDNHGGVDQLFITCSSSLGGDSDTRGQGRINVSLSGPANHGAALSGPRFTYTRGQSLSQTPTPASLTITVANDTMAQGDRTVTINANTNNVNGYGWDHVENPWVHVSETHNPVPDSITLRIIDPDTPRRPVTLTLASPTINESGAGNSTTVTASVATAPSANLTITVSAAAGATVDPSANTLTIESGEMSSTTAATASQRSVTITAADNDVDAATDPTVTVSATTSDSVYTASAVTLTITDDDTAALALSDLASATDPRDTVAEGGTETFGVALGSAPTANVTVTALANDNTEC